MFKKLLDNYNTKKCIIPKMKYMQNYQTCIKLKKQLTIPIVN